MPILSEINWPSAISSSTTSMSELLLDDISYINTYLIMEEVNAHTGFQLNSSQPINKPTNKPTNKSLNTEGVYYSSTDCLRLRIWPTHNTYAYIDTMPLEILQQNLKHIKEYPYRFLPEWGPIFSDLVIKKRKEILAKESNQMKGFAETLNFLSTLNKNKKNAHLTQLHNNFTKGKYNVQKHFPVKGRKTKNT